jgi:two-component system CheB/CheR fusion protein
MPALFAHVLDAGQLAQVILDGSRNVVVINERARHMFGLSAADRGKPFQDLELSYRPAEVRSLIEQAEREERAVTVSGVEWTSPGGGKAFLDVTVSPLVAGSGEPAGTAITFADVTRYHAIETDLRRTQREVETAYEELQSTVEELETTNEELQSTNEELETTNEELQSSNEELETMNEELQSTNEELETINDELRQRSNELNDVNFFFESVLLSLEAGVVVTDADLRVMVWNQEAQDLWGLRADEVIGQHLLNLDIGLPVDALREPVRACLTGQSTREVLDLPATNRRGRAIVCRVACVPLPREDSIHGVVILMEPVDQATGGEPQQTAAS